MATQFFIRFTNDITKDLKIGTSIITTDNNRIANGLCVFYGANDIESSHKKAQMFGKRVSEKGDKYFILKGIENRIEKAGSLGTLMYAEDAEVLAEGVIE